MKRRRLAVPTALLSLALIAATLPVRADWYDNEATLMEKGKRLYQSGNFAEALKPLEDSIRLNPNRAESYYWRGIAYHGLNDFNMAIESLNKAIQLDGTRGTYYLSRGLLYSNQGKHEEAIKDYSEALRLDPSLQVARANKEFSEKEIARLQKLEAEKLAKAEEEKKKPEEGQIAQPSPADLRKAQAEQLKEQKAKIELALKEKREAEALAREQKLAERQLKELARLQAETDRLKQLNSKQNTVAEKPKTETPATTDKVTEVTKNPGKVAEAIEEAATIVNRPVKDKWALIVGISSFQDPKLNLNYPSKDAQDFYKFLTTEGNFQKDHVKLLVNEQATRGRILSELGDKWLPRVANPDDLVVIYISSHGSPSDLDVGGVNYLLAYDTDVNSLYASGIPMQDLARIIKGRVHSDRVVVILDACHSGAADPGSKGINRTGNLDVESIAQGTGQLVISSSQPSEVSWESKTYANSVFTSHLIHSLKMNGDKTTLGQAFDNMKEKVREEVLRERGVMQTPVLKSKWKGQDLLLCAPPSSPRAGLADEHHGTPGPQNAQPKPNEPPKAAQHQDQ